MSDWLRDLVFEQGGWANIPPKTNRKSPICFSPWLYKQRNLIERFFNKLKYYRRIATRYDKLGSSFLAMVKLACIRLRLRHTFTDNNGFSRTIVEKDSNMVICEPVAVEK